MRLKDVTALAALFLSFSVCACAEEVTTDNLAREVEKLFRNRPDIVMDVLRRESESVLDIAQQGSNQRRRRSLEVQWRSDMKSEKSVRLEGRPVYGPPKAKVRIVAFSDFTCHFCRQAASTVNEVLRDYGKDVCLIFKNFPLENKGVAMQAAMAFLAMAQQSNEKAWEFYSVLFAERDRLMGEGEGFINRTAEGVGADMKKLQRDVKSKKIADMLAEDIADGQKIGVEGTPFFLVNNLVIRGALPPDLFRAAVDMALAEKSRQGNSQ
ncbi:MAG: thioredoxin domain-containing protein [Desulfovibrio sp.]|jgi:protein-disulfide isomerase|nr:thioredoxin domain-containing protein [Desulfovibrio sp.]